jgi:hypothetical protein
MTTYKDLSLNKQAIRAKFYMFQFTALLYTHWSAATTLDLPTTMELTMKFGNVIDFSILHSLTQ